jgi:predicted DNA-binding protein with PD1-like motif
MKTLPLRLSPGDDLRAALSAAIAAAGVEAAFVVAGIGSLREARLRLAGRDAPRHVVGDLEILTLSGTLGAGGAHLHMSVSDADGRVLGGHVSPGCVVRTTAEVLLALLDDVRFTREPDAATGYAELHVWPRGGA